MGAYGSLWERTSDLRSPPVSEVTWFIRMPTLGTRCGTAGKIWEAWNPGHVGNSHLNWVKYGELGLLQSGWKWCFHKFLIISDDPKWRFFASWDRFEPSEILGRLGDGIPMLTWAVPPISCYNTVVYCSSRTTSLCRLKPMITYIYIYTLIPNLSITFNNPNCTMFFAFIAVCVGHYHFLWCIWFIVWFIILIG